MGKGKRNRKKHKRDISPPIESPDIEAVFAGTVAWDADELGEVLEEHMRLLATPHDDWDRRERAFILHDEDGTATHYRFNPDVIDVQISMYMAQRFRDRSETERMSHMMRYFAIREFMAEHHDDLIDVGLIFPDPDKKEFEHVSSELLHQLAISPYERQTKAVDEEPEIVLDFDRIVERVKAGRGSQRTNDG